MSRIIWWLNRKATGRETILEMVLFDNLSNNSNFTDNIRIVEILYFCMNTVLTKQLSELKMVDLTSFIFFSILFYFILILILD